MVNHSVFFRASEYNLFGIEDKDYRHQVRSDDRLQSKHGSQSQTKHVHPKNARGMFSRNKLYYFPLQMCIFFSCMIK